MKKSAALLAIFATLGMSSPSFAGCLDTGKSVAGTTTAMIVDVPEGIIVNTLAKCPRHARESLAATFGDENGWKQNIAGALIGWPAGMAFGVPYGLVKGAQHAASVGWEKPFSKESFVVTNESK
jgi:hypothetical protein